ncbi:thymidylate kinase [Planosporangium flavigriseum]|uniref:Thymidylate kinase n=1 Tax=Planosporangium flavigriseum TaxID=373681 RepID=A0A8J3LRP1_9ACTN|nr:thymidylate kinase [Planosporangium flavigriseum]NJC64567.1 thymidylate kinase [Planosporangium flavigriseum]GIG71950.1 thymidylate kinase [Planosporangium flavigriseum]
MAHPVIVALVGIDGSGKTTQAKMLAEWLTTCGATATYFANPGGRLFLGRLAHRLGRADAIDLLGRRGFTLVETLLRWLNICRAVVWSRLSRRTAVMDRYSYCQYVTMRTRADQGDRFARILYSVFPRPDLVCFLDVAPVEAHRRVERRGTDSESLSYLSDAATGYRSLPEFESFTVVDANGSPGEVQATLRQVVGHRLNDQG